MKCPKCKTGKAKYLKKRPGFSKKEDKAKYARTDFRAKCNKCEWTGVIH